MTIYDDIQTIYRRCVRIFRRYINDLPRYTTIYEKSVRAQEKNVRARKEIVGVGGPEKKGFHRACLAEAASCATDLQAPFHSFDARIEPALFEKLVIHFLMFLRFFLSRAATLAVRSASCSRYTSYIVVDYIAAEWGGLGDGVAEMGLQRGLNT